MADQDDTASTTGYSRRAIIQRGAAATGVIWVAPVIESFTNRAGAQVVGSPPPDEAVVDISYVALLINCGGVCVRTKFEIEESVQEFCGDDNTPFCSDMVTCPGESPCPSGVEAVIVAEGVLQVTLPPGCTLLDFRVKCGMCCEGPGSTLQPSLDDLGSGSFVFRFNKCNGNGGGFPCEPSPYTDLLKKK